MTVCAASVLAMVFSVQQGEHGPLVVYKLQVPRDAGTVAAPAPPAPAQAATAVVEAPETPAAPAPRLSPLQPTILGTVVMPAGWTPSPAPPETSPQITPAATFGGLPLQEPASQPVPLSVPSRVPSAETVYRIVEGLPDGYRQDGGPLINTQTGGALTLDEVNDVLTWRRDTAQKLRSIPIAPRF